MPPKSSDDPARFRYEQLVCELSGLIRAGTFAPGERLPSVRKLKQQKKISATTILQAYRLLEDQGLVEAKPQSGFYVRPQIFMQPNRPRLTEPRSNPCEVDISDFLLEFFDSVSCSSIVPLGAAIPAGDLLPREKIYGFLAAAARSKAVDPKHYVCPRGIRPLRHQIARRVYPRGVNLTDDDIMITCGATEAITLCLSAVAKAGDVIAVESPTYFGTLQIIECLGMRALEIPTCPTEGIQVTSLERIMQHNDIKAVLVQPSFHNPLGCVMPEADRADLVALCTRHQVPIIEDDLYGELSFEAPPPDLLKKHDRDGWVLTCSSFSKTLTPELRIGWVAPGRFFRQVQRAKLGHSLATAIPQQQAIAEFMRKGGYDHAIRRMRRVFCASLSRAIQAIGEWFPPETKATRPLGGFVLWVELPAEVNAMCLYREALDRGVSIAPGRLFSANDQYNNHIRLNCGVHWDTRVENAFKTLGHLTHELANPPSEDLLVAN